MIVLWSTFFYGRVLLCTAVCPSILVLMSSMVSVKKENNSKKVNNLKLLISMCRLCTETLYVNRKSRERFHWDAVVIILECAKNGQANQFKVGYVLVVISYQPPCARCLNYYWLCCDGGWFCLTVVWLFTSPSFPASLWPHMIKARGNHIDVLKSMHTKSKWNSVPDTPNQTGTATTEITPTIFRVT